jgi:hypothetical protein
MCASCVTDGNCWDGANVKFKQQIEEAERRERLWEKMDEREY